MNVIDFPAPDGAAVRPGVRAMNLDMNTIVLGLVLGCIGMGLFKNGKAGSKPLHIFAGLALMVVPYFIESTGTLLVVSGLLIALPLATHWL